MINLIYQIESLQIDISQLEFNENNKGALNEKAEGINNNLASNIDPTSSGVSYGTHSDPKPITISSDDIVGMEYSGII